MNQRYIDLMVKTDKEDRGVPIGSDGESSTSKDEDKANNCNSDDDSSNNGIDPRNISWIPCVKPTSLFVDTMDNWVEDFKQIAGLTWQQNVKLQDDHGVYLVQRVHLRHHWHLS
jgi:hypothetical protein